MKIHFILFLLIVIGTAIVCSTKLANVNEDVEIISDASETRISEKITEKKNHVTTRLHKSKIRLHKREAKKNRRLKVRKAIRKIKRLAKSGKILHGNRKKKSTKAISKFNKKLMKK